MTIPAAQNIEVLVKFLEAIKTAKVPVPRYFTDGYFEKHGFKSSSYPEIRDILRLLGLLSQNDIPLKRWRDFREHGTSVLQTAVRECYRDLFAKIPDAQNRPDEELELWFRSHIAELSPTSIVRAIKTFRNLCGVARLTATDGESVDRSGTAFDRSIFDLTDDDSGRFTFLVIQSPIVKDKPDCDQIVQSIKKAFFPERK